MMIDSALMLDVARFAHVLCIAVGFGAAFLADYQIARQLARPVDERMLHLVDLCHDVIWKIVIGMWITGLILIQIRTQFVLANFTPKLVSKLIVVGILTVNSGLISRVAMPLLRRARGQSLLALPLGSRLTLAVIGAVSSASWLLAMAMGSSKVLAASDGSVFVILLPLGYLAAIALAVGVMARLYKGDSVLAGWLSTRVATGHRAEHRFSAPVPVPAPIPANRHVGTTFAAK
jgi:hypothetical protein